MRYEYKVVIDWKRSDFEAECTDMLNRAWVLHGHPTIKSGELGNFFAQAFIREVPEEGEK